MTDSGRRSLLCLMTCVSATCGESRIKRHAPIDKQGRAGDIVGCIRLSGPRAKLHAGDFNRPAELVTSVPTA
jgi:hypothetical protein